MTYREHERQIGGTHHRGAASRQTHVLVVDDEPVIRRLVVDVLSNAGYSVTSASDGQEAIDASVSNSGDLDVLVTDYVMPGLSGLELATELKSRWPNLRVLMLSGHVRPDALTGSAHLDVSFLRKPFSIGDLLRCTAALCSESS